MTDSTASEGCLYVVATPIGNRGDFTPRAAEIMAACDCIAAEEPRKVLRLFTGTLKLSAPVVALHEHNESELAEQLVKRIANGEQIALVAEAGTPLISDPGFRLVRACRQRGLRVTPIPGPCAATTALSAAGLPSDGFLFLGFLPPKSAARRRTFKEYSYFPYTLILYESTHRIEKFLNDLVDILGADRVICVARELTKLHETIHTGPAGAVRERVVAGSTKGEFVVLIAKQDFML